LCAIRLTFAADAISTPLSTTSSKSKTARTRRSSLSMWCSKTMPMTEVMRIREKVVAYRAVLRLL